ncbi:MAG: hypothetical protein ACM3KM_02985 [Acidobacteriaceae bacterium]
MLKSSKPKPPEGGWKMQEKTAYICGPLTELPDELKGPVKALYSKLGDICQEVMGIRAFVPHEHFDPVAMPNFTPQEVDTAERHQVCDLTSVLVVVAIQPTWGGGIEVEMANRSGIPAIILKPVNKNISRLLRGNPAVQGIVQYETFAEAEIVLKGALELLILKS